MRAAGYETFFLSTCLRIELAWLGDRGAIHEVFGLLYGGDVTHERGVVRGDADAFHHLCRVAAGLDSPLVGEPEVLAQFRRAVAGLNRGPGSLVRTLEAAVGVARSSRRLLHEVPRGSLAAVAAQMARPLGRVAVLGGGAMARAALGHLEGADVTLLARKPTPVSGHAPRSWDGVADTLATFPAVISTVPGKTPVLSDVEFAAALARRHGPLVLVDLGMPPGFTRPDADRGVRYLGVDDLAATVANPSAVAAEESLAEAAASMWRRMTGDDRAGSVIAAVIEQAEAAVAEEVTRFASRLAGVDDPEQVLRQVAHTVARRVLHPAISYLATTDETSVEVVAEAFGVET